MLLILTNSQDAHADYLIPILRDQSIRLLRFDTDRSIAKTELHWSGDGPSLVVDGETYRPDDFTNLWYRRPERLKSEGSGDSPEERFMLSEWAESLEGIFALIPPSRWMNHPSLNVAASHKIEQLVRAQSLGFQIPETLLTQNAASLRHFFDKHHGRIITKPLATGYIERPNDSDSLIYTNQVSANQLDDLDDLRRCPTLFQQLIEKQLDVRITVVDGELHAIGLSAADETGRQRCDIRRNNMDDVSYCPVKLPSDIRAKVIALMQSYSLRFGAIDMAVSTSDEWYFFEINPNGQWAWLDLAGATEIAPSFVRSFAT